MGALAKITISLPEEMLAEVKAAVEAGEFTNTSEAIRDALRQWRRARSVMALSDAELRRVVAKGLDGHQLAETDATLKRLRAKYTALLAGGGR